MRKYSSFLLVLCLFVELQAQEVKKIVILHSNDTHSQIEPFSKNAVRHADMGGYARRAGVIDSIRGVEETVFLFDDGDFCQGTPYFNVFGGRLEVEGFNKMSYDCVTLGNHEFDNGIDSLAMILELAKFPVVASNYDVSRSLLKDKVLPWLILERNGVKIGVISTNVNPDGLIMKKSFKGIKYKDPIKTANKYSKYLKEKEHCDLIVCLSHLGSDSTEVVVNDFQLAHQSKHIDLILGGHSHTLLENVKTFNAEGRPVLIAQMGRSGLFLGKVELLLEAVGKK